MSTSKEISFRGYDVISWYFDSLFFKKINHTNLRKIELAILKETV